MCRSLFERLYKKSYFKACEGYKTATDAARESRECLHSMPSCEEEKPHLWVNLLEVNEDFGDKHNDKRAFLVSLFAYYKISALLYKIFFISYNVKPSL